MNPMILLLLMFSLLLLGAVAVGAALFFFQRYSNPEPSLLQQRLAGMKERQRQDNESVMDGEAAKRFSKLYKGSVYQNEELGAALERVGFFRTLMLRMQQAGMSNPDQYIMKAMLMPGLLGLATCVVLGPLGLGVAGLLVGAGYANILWKRSKRYSQFVTQLPDALSMITSALRAGHSFQSAMGIVSTEMGNPIAVEFATVVRDINLGIPVKEALARMVVRLDALPDVRMFSTAVIIQREAGGNLAEVLEKLGYTIRERFKLKRQIAALTGQSRMTGYVLGAAPLLLLSFLTVVMYGYVKPLYETEIGHLILLAILILQVIGFIIMKKIIDIRV
jgi:tight adherence protein B